MLSDNRLMKIVANGLLFLGCLFGGVVSASVFLMIIAASVLDLRDLNQVPEFLAATSRTVQLLGATVGAFIYFRHRAQSSGAATKY